MSGNSNTVAACGVKYFLLNLVLSAGIYRGANKIIFVCMFQFSNNLRVILPVTSVRQVKSIVKRFLKLVVVGALIIPFSSAMATSLSVDNGNIDCSDAPVSGSILQPFCTIAYAATRTVAGDRVVVNSGSYPEYVEIEQSGVSGSPIIFKVAAGETVVISGQDKGFDLSDVSWIIVEGFDIDSTIRTGIALDTVSDIIVRDNNITNAGKRGIEVKYSNDIMLSNNEVASSFDYGIYVRYSNAVTVSGNYVSGSGLPAKGFVKKGVFFDNTIDSFIIGNTAESNTNSGISISGGSNNNQVIGNHVFNNARGYVRAAPGIEIRTSTNNTIEANDAHDNEDTGIQLYTGSDANFIKNNITYNNGDHGIDLLNSANNFITNNTVYRNVTAGINVEGTSTGTTIGNNIVVDNAINSPRTRGNVRVDITSAPGSSLNYNLYDMTIQPNVLITWDGFSYFSLLDLQQNTMQETMGLHADPGWVNQDAGDFRLTSGSTAIDSADSTEALDTDFDMLARVDDPLTVDTGIGPSSYYDRGAHEFYAENIPPTVAITEPNNEANVSGQAAIFASANDIDGTVASVQFQVDGNVIGAEVTTAPYSIVWDSSTVVDGIHELTAVVTDNEGSSAVSELHNVTVTNSVPVQISFIATDDAYVKQSSPNDVRGSTTKVWLDTLPNRYEVFMKFEITGIGFRPVNEAKLVLQTANSSVEGGEVYQVLDNTWTEQTVTWNNAPANEPLPIGSFGSVKKGNAAVLDMTSVITGDGIYSIRINAVSADAVGYYSKETAGLEPRISILTIE